jgi:hypothetical protein
MTPEEQLELDQLKQELRLTKAVEADLKDKLKAMELNVFQTQREAKKTMEEAQALRTEVESSIDVAADQMRVAHSVGLGIFGMAELCRARVARASTSARFVYREYHLLERIEAFLKAQASNDQAGMKQALDYLKEKAASIRHDSEANRHVATEQWHIHGLTNFERVWQDMLDSQPSKDQS